MQLHSTQKNVNESPEVKLQEQDKGNKQVSIEHFYTKKAKDTSKVVCVESPNQMVVVQCEATLNVQDQLCKAKTLWALKNCQWQPCTSVFRWCAWNCSRECFQTHL